MSKLGPDLDQFQDPWGLLRRMVLSGDPAARWVLMQRAASLLARPLDGLLGHIETRRNQDAAPVHLPLILIVGAPRAGTTLLHQVLVRGLNVAYFDNLGSLFPRATLTGRSLFGRPSRAAPSSFSSFYGSTAGWRAPNDGFHVWNRWLGDHRYRAKQELSEAEAEDMRRFFAHWLKWAGKPLLNKNNRNADCVPMLADALEDAVFVEISREPEYVVQSLLLARVEVQGRVEHGWGLDSEPVDPGADRETAIDAVCYQVMRIQRKLERAASMVGPDRFMSLRYEDLCSDPGAIVRSVAAFVPQVELRRDADLGKIGPFPPRNEPRLPAWEIRRIRDRWDALR